MTEAEEAEMRRTLDATSTPALRALRAELAQTTASMLIVMLYDLETAAPDLAVEMKTVGEPLASSIAQAAILAAGDELDARLPAAGELAELRKRQHDLTVDLANMRAHVEALTLSTIAGAAKQALFAALREAPKHPNPTGAPCEHPCGSSVCGPAGGGCTKGPAR